ncbi:hypothetical protein FPY71_07290 [Aureimonas fodinaquatilis]|uniref:Uncharacterized protein n=1 Tax=Aureimonas fodinaquatilis TaxID=2565783 RepID=A0A5B0DWX4_9HYPH|nr:hypothetical protein [Aureimonas fodinaquatilis]KAA0970321.1 hypothetical protein FPY71_07290 [Aureimonas fodinaquatilis]
MKTVTVARLTRLATVRAADSLRVTSIETAPAREGSNHYLDVLAIASTSGLVAPTVRVAPIRLRVPAIGPESGVVSPNVRPAPIRLLTPPIAATSGLFSPALRPAPIRLTVPAIASGSGVLAPTARADAPWYDNPMFDTWGAGVDWNNDRAFMPIGPKVGGKYPKREAAISEIITIEGPAGRSYIPVNGLPFSYDTPENAPRISWDRGKRQYWIDPTPRFNRIYNAAIFITPVTIHMINYSYLFSFYGTGYVECTGDTVPGGSWRLDGTGANEMVWAFLPHPDSGDVTVTPHGDVRFINVDTHGVTGLDPNYPTNFIPTGNERVDRPREHAVLAPDIVAMLGQAGSMLIQGQFTTGVNNLVPGGNNRRVIVGWDHDAYLGIDGDGNVVNNTGHGNLLSTPLGSGDSYDPFRVVFSFQDRDGVGGDGIRRVAANGGAVAQHAHPWQGGPGDHTGFTLARVPNWFQAQDAGAGGYDLMLFSPELMAATDVQAASVYS